MLPQVGLYLFTKYVAAPLVSSAAQSAGKTIGTAAGKAVVSGVSNLAEAIGNTVGEVKNQVLSPFNPKDTSVNTEIPQTEYNNEALKAYLATRLAGGNFYSHQENFNPFRL